MKILTASNYYYEKMGGIEMVTHNLVKNFRASGHEVRWIACDVKEVVRPESADDVRLRCWNFTESKLGFPYPLPSPFDLVNTIRQVRWCDVVHLHDCLYLHNQFLYRIARIFKKPIVTTQHIAFSPYAQSYKNLLQQATYKTIGRALLESSAQVVFVNQTVQDWFQGFVNFKSKPFVLPNGFDPEIFGPMPEDEISAVRASLNIPADNPLLLFVGRFTEKKGVQFIREAALKKPDWSWVLVGEAAEQDPRAWSLPNVKVLGPQTQSELRRLYNAASLVVLPSIREGFPLVLCEAMACGTPVAVCREAAQAVDGLSELVLTIDAASGKLTETLADALAHPEQLRNLKPRLVEFAQERLNWKAVADRYCELFAALASGEQISGQVAVKYPALG
jgi:Glycosyltransferase